MVVHARTLVASGIVVRGEPGSLVGASAAMPEITDFATLVLVVAGGFSLAVLSTKLTERVPVPAPAVFLVAAAVVSDLLPGLYEHVPIRAVERIAVVALVVILFNGGIDMGMQRLRASAPPVLSLGLLGTFLTAAGIAVVAHVLLGMSWTLAGLVGAALAPTDPAVMFSVLGRREVAGRSGTTLEGEAGVNDPAGIALMLGMIELVTHADATMLVVAREFVVQMGVGLAFGLLGGRLFVRLLQRLRLPSESLYPVLALMLAGVLYGLASVAHGSGFLAVFCAGLLVGDARLPYKTAIERFQGSLAGLAELVVFVALGATVKLADLALRDWLQGLVLVAALALVIRPLVVATTLSGVHMSRAEKGFIAFSGLKGAVPVLLAAFAILGGVADGERLYGLVFIAVLFSVAVQGTLVPLVARRLRIPMRLQDRLPWELSLRVGREPTGAREYRVAPASPADGLLLGQLPLGDQAWVTLLVRGGDALQPNPDVQLRPGDRLLILADSARTHDLHATFATADRRAPVQAGTGG
jgi:potassium/hydrogen antiporter